MERRIGAAQARTDQTRGRHHQFYDLSGRRGDVVVHDTEVELVLGGQLDLRGAQAPGALLGLLGAAADEPLDEFVPARRQQEHQGRRRLRGAHLARALQIDLEQHRAARPASAASIGRRGRAVAEPVVHGRVLEQLAVGDEAVELGVVDEVVVLAVDLARPRRRGSSPRPRGGSRGGASLMLRGDGALADRGRPGEHDEPAASAARPRLGPSLVEEVLQRAALPRAEPAEPLHRRDRELAQDAVALALADRRDAREELGDAHRAGGRRGVGERPPQQLLRR